MSLGALATLPRLYGSLGPRWILATLAAGLVFSLPRLSWLWTLSHCDAGGALSCLARVAGGSAEEGLGSAELLWRALHDRAAVELGLGAMVSGLGLLLAVAPGRGRTASGLVFFVAFGLLGVLLLGLSLSTLRPYHLRHLAVPVAVLAGLGWSRLGPGALLATIPLFVAWSSSQGAAGAPRAAALHDELARRLPAGAVRVETLNPGRPGPVDAAGIVLSAVLSGQERTRFTVGPQVPLVLVLGDEVAVSAVGADLGRTLAQVGGAELRAFEDLGVARRSLCPTLTPSSWLSGAADWLGAVRPESPGLGTDAWSCP